MFKSFKKLWLSGLLLSLLGLTFTSQAQTPQSVAKPVEMLNEYNSRFPLEKVYLHTDRKHYAPGEPIWFQAYVLAGYFHEPSPLSNNLYVSLYKSDKSLVDQQLVRVDMGAGHGMMELPEDLEGGSYVLRAYTQWMRNFDEDYFFEKELIVLGPESADAGSTTQLDIDVQFFPEGGHLIDKVASRVAFKAIDNNGDAVDVSGIIYDNSDQEVTRFETNHEGMGILVFTPEKGKSYRAEVAGREFPYNLPPVEAQGISLSANNNLKDVLRITFRSNDATRKKDKLGVVVHARGAVSFAFDVDVSKNIAFINLPKANLPAGINHITLFDSKGNPLVERLVFIDHQKENIEFNTDRASYGKREKVTATLRVTDAEGQPVSGMFSMAALDLGQSADEAPEQTILSNLLLSSDLKGYIAQPMYYFDTTNPDAKKHLDLVMMTHGWSRFTWKSLPDRLQTPPEFGIEQGLNVEGKLNRIASDKAAAGGEVMLINQQSSPPLLMKKQVGADGLFVFDKVVIYDDQEVVFQGANKKGKPLVDIVVDSLLKTVPVDQFGLRLQSDVSELVDMQRFNEKKKYRDQIEEAYNFDTTATDLGTVVVEGSRIKAKEAEERESIYGKGDNTLRFEDTDAIAANNPLEMLVGKIAGVTVTGAGANTSVNIRGSVTNAGNALEPLLLIDDVPTDVASLNSFPANLIERVEVFKGPSAAIFGVRGSGGVLAFYTKKGGNLSVRPSQGVLSTYLKNSYKQPRAFYAPKYETKKPEHIKPDSRIVLFWAPLIVLDENGTAQIEFWNSDQETEVLIDLQGITKSGSPLATTLKYNISK